jgi:hypothetical protein
MSAYLCDSETFSLLAAYWCRDGRNPDELVHRLQRAVDQTRLLLLPGEKVPSAELLCKAAGNVRGAVFGALVLENLRSLEARYPYNKEEDRALADQLQLEPVGSADLRPEVSGRVAAAVAELDYQSCEHSGWERSLAFFLLEQVRCQLLGDLQGIATPDRVSHG